MERNKHDYTKKPGNPAKRIFTLIGLVAIIGLLVWSGFFFYFNKLVPTLNSSMGSAIKTAGANKQNYVIPEKGLLINTVLDPESGLQNGDIMTSYNGQPVI